jgi:ribosomal protein S18
MKDFGQKLEDDNSLGMQAYRTILNLGFWKKLVYILEKKISLHLCLKFFDFKNYMLLMKVFVSQEEKIKNRALLDVWTLKTQIKGFLITKQRILARYVHKHQFAALIEEFSKECADTVSAVQLNQR